jgi:NAD(P)-dependent dehydrogenase (short-subunit alcohol dehydrogenase family)
MRVFITGTTSGFGSLMAEAFLKEGATVIASGRRLSSRKEILQGLHHQFPGRLHEIDLDVTDASQRAQALQFCQRSLGGIDVLINNAGSGLFGALEDCTEEQVRQQMEVNFFGTALMCREFLPLLRESRGKIFNFSSVLGFQGLPLTSLYNASKFAVEGLSEGLAYELQSQGVQVCIVQPGSFSTKFMNSSTWAENAENDSSPYRRQTRNYHQLRAAMTANPRYPNPEIVVRGVVRLAKKKTVPLRVTFGKDAHGTAFIRKLLPAELYYRISAWALGRRFNA